MARRRSSLLTKLVGVSLLPTLVLLGVFGYFAQERGRRSLDEELGRRLISIAESASAVVLPAQFAAIQPEDETTQTYLSVRHKLADLRARTQVARIELVGPEGGVRATTDEGVAIGTPAVDLTTTDNAEMQRALRGEPAASVLFRGYDGLWYKRGYAPIRDDSGAILGVVAVQAPAEYFAQLGRFRRWLLAYGLAGAALVVLISAAVARRITRPVRELAGAAERIGYGDLTHAVPKLRSRDEIALLAETLEEMRASLRARDERMQMMLSGIAHEVRNPLGGIELFAGLLREEVAGDAEKTAHVGRIERELEHLKTVVAQFLEYSRRPPPELARVDCRALLEDVRDVLGKDLADAEVACTLEVSGAPAAHADVNQLRRALLNLGRNAIQATPRGGKVELGAQNGDGRVRIAVRDSGGGIATEHLPNIFLPFYTTKEKGTGLGLAFVRDIARDHGARLAVDSAPGRGTTFTLALPEAT